MPTPLPPLAGVPGDFRLQPLNETGALALLAEAAKSARPGDYAVEARQVYAATIAREMLLRFPGSTPVVTAAWQLLREQRSISLPSSDERTALFAAMVENALYGGKVEPAGLVTWLETLGFAAEIGDPVPGLLGDGQPGAVLAIGWEARQSMEPLDAVFVLAQSAGGQYQLILVRDEGLLIALPSFTRTGQVLAKDLNGDGRPEIVTTLYHDRHMDFAVTVSCGAKLSVHEWDGTRFVDLAKGLSYEAENLVPEGCPAAWSFEEPAAGRAPSIILSDPHPNAGGQSCLAYERRVRYSWDGTRYALAEEWAVPLDPAQPAECALGWASAAARDGFYAQAAPIVAAALDRWPASADAAWGPAAQDYFRLQLGVWHALDGRSAAALEVLADLRDRPANPEYDAAATMASAFLEAYAGGNDLYGACTQAHDRAEAEFSQAVTGPADTLLPAWGFSEPAWKALPAFGIERFVAGTICSPAQAWRALIGKAPPEAARDWNTWFDRQRIPAEALAAGELDSDGKYDWLVALETGPKRFDLYILAQNPSSWSPVLLASGIRTVEPLMIQSLDRLYSEMRTFRLISYGDELRVIRLEHAGSAWGVATALGVSDVERFEILDGTGGTALRVETRRENGTVQDLYFWQAGRRRFEPVPRSLVLPGPAENQFIAAVERLLFVDGDVATTPGKLQRALAPYHTGDIVPHLRYLIGVACELSGDERGAVEAYWQIAHDTPGSPYARAAHARLVPIDP